MITTADSHQTISSQKFASFRWMLVLGILLRLAALNQPLLDAHSTRQTQTADWTRHALREGGWPMSAEVSWRGDTHARLVLEFPLYSYLVMGVWSVIRNLDMAGKLVTVILWALSFVVLQKIWRRLLNPQQAFWANLLFVLSPLSVFFGQAFTPEMAVQLFAFLMLHQLLLYRDTRRLKDYSLFAIAGLLGLLTKSLEISHLYLVALVVFWKMDGIQFAKQARHWIWGAVTVVCYVAWTRHVDQVNQEFFPAWTASHLSKEFLGHWQQRLDWHFYFKVAAYVTAFIAGPFGVCIAVLGFLRRTPENRFGFWWLYSLAFFYLVWGMNTAGLHSYYNLPALGPLCFLFGLGMPVLNDRFVKLRSNAAWVRSSFGAMLMVLVFAPLLGCSAYLFRKDWTIYEAAQWIREHSQENDLVVLRFNHRRDNNAYPEYPVFSYYAQRMTWIDTVRMKEPDREHALATARWSVITRPPTTSSWSEKIRDKIARYPALEDVPNWPPAGRGFVPIYSNERMTISRKEKQP